MSDCSKKEFIHVSYTEETTIPCEWYEIQFNLEDLGKFITPERLIHCKEIVNNNIEKLKEKTKDYETSHYEIMNLDQRVIIRLKEEFRKKDVQSTNKQQIKNIKSVISVDGKPVKITFAGQELTEF